jgi:hypothetical protein
MDDTPETSTEFAKRAILLYVEANPDDPAVVRLRELIAQLKRILDAD